MGKLYFIDVIKGRLYSSLIQQLACLSQITLGHHSIAQVTLVVFFQFFWEQKDPFPSKRAQDFKIELFASYSISQGRCCLKPAESPEIHLKNMNSRL
jgi:hypothetical protein